MVVFFVIASSLILPKDFVEEFPYQIGKTWVAASLRAEFDYPLYKPEEQIQEERNRAASAVYPVFQVDTAARDLSRLSVANAVSGMRSELNRIRRASNEDDPALEGILTNFQETYRLDANDFLAFNPDPEQWESRFLRLAEAFIEVVYSSGFIDTTKAQIGDDIIYVRRTSNIMVQKSLTLERQELPDFLATEFPALESEERLLFRVLVIPNLLPNLYYSAKESTVERKRARDLVSPVFAMVRKGDVIISEGERIGDRQSLRIRSYTRARDEKFGAPPYLVTFGGQLVMMTIITILLMLFIRNNREKIYNSMRRLALVLLLFLTMIGLLILILKLSLVTQGFAGLHYVFMVPMCMAVIFLSAFFDTRFAFFGNLILSLIAGSIVPNGFEYFFIQWCAGTAAVYSLTRLRNRADFFISLVIILGAYVVTFLGYNFYIKGNFTEINYVNLALFAINVILTFIAYPLIYVFERLFGLTSDLTFMELLDTNHPLLKELSNRAPGTFQHSIQVANITEAVLNRIGGNSLQAKVSALFHDIGKMKQPMCYIENLGDHASPHDNLSHLESAAIIIRHVTEGVRLAQEHSLPKEVIDYIRTHHGTTRVEFFYRKHMEEHPDEAVDPALFSYPGPIPFTREMAVLMIADSIEAASRSLKDPSPEKLHDLIEKIVEGKVQQNQFAKAPITFKDLGLIKEVIYEMLVSIYHGRIEYPEEPANLPSAAPKGTIEAMAQVEGQEEPATE